MITTTNSRSLLGWICFLLLFVSGNLVALSIEQPAVKQDPQGQVNALIGQLGAETYEQREAAEKALVTLAATEETAVLDACLAAHDRNSDPEVQYRCMKILQQLVNGPIYNRPRGYLGVQLVSIPPNLPEEINVERVILIQGVSPGSSAAEAGVEAGDIVLAINQVSMGSFGSVSRFIFHIQRHPPGSTVALLVLRQGSPKLLFPVLGQAGDDVAVKKFAPAEFFKIWLESTRDRLARSRRY